MRASTRSFAVSAAVTAALLLPSAATLLGQEGGSATNGGFIGDYRVADEKKDPSKLPHIGAWRINLDKSAPALRKRFQPTATQIFIVENGGIRHQVFNAYPPKDDSYKTTFTPEAREYWFKLDGQNIYENPQGPNGQGQTVAMWLDDTHTIYRERYTKGVRDEWVLYRVSPDGKSMVWTPFNANGDSGQMYWDRVAMPTR
jgi:hypothetical protein